jgi:glucokinase
MGVATDPTRVNNPRLAPSAVAETGARVIAVDLGGTNLRAAAISLHGELSLRRRVPTGAADGPDAVIARMVEVIATVAEAAGFGGEVPVGVAVPGPLNPRTGIVHFTPNLANWHDVPLLDRLRAATGRAVWIGNDGNCAALGEARFGSGAGTRNLVYFALGTGVGGGVITDGRLVEGALGLGGEVGHIVVAQAGPRCRCGGVGCLEAYASGWALAREGELVGRTADGAALRAAAGTEPMTAQAVAAAANAGDPAAVAILRRAGQALGAAMGSLINIFNPELVVLGGGVIAAGDPLLQPAREAVAQHAFPAPRAQARIVCSALGPDAGLFGAAALALAAVEERLSDDGRQGTAAAAILLQA